MPFERLSMSRIVGPVANRPTQIARMLLRIAPYPKIAPSLVACELVASKSSMTTESLLSLVLADAQLRASAHQLAEPIVRA